MPLRHYYQDTFVFIRLLLSRLKNKHVALKMTCNFKGPSLTLFEQRFGFSFTILHLSGKNGQYYSWITQSFKTSCKGCFRSVQTVQWFIVAISFNTTNSKLIRYMVLKLNFVWSHLRFLKFFFKGGGVAAFYFKQFLEWFTFFLI